MEVYRFKQCFTFPLSFLARLAMRHTQTFADGILNYAHWAFKGASIGPLLNLHMCIFYLWESFDLDRAWVRDSRPYKISFLS